MPEAHMTFYFAELLYTLQRWKQAATQYEAVIKIKESGEYLVMQLAVLCRI